MDKTEASPEELADAGVELSDPPPPPTPEPPRVPFEEGELPGEPLGDVKLTLASGEVLRERIVLLHQGWENVTTPSAGSAPTMIIVGISNALLDGDDKVARNAEGKPIIATAYPVTCTAEGLGRIGTEAELRAALNLERQAAAAKAAIECRGMALVGALLGRVQAANSEGQASMDELMLAAQARIDAAGGEE